MNHNVMIKSNKYGLEVHLNPDIPFQELLEDVARKFGEASKFFANSALAASFEGREVTRLQEQQLIDVISATANIHIVCVIDNNKTTEQLYRSIVEQCEQDKKNREGQFYKGNLKKRQLLESETSIIVLGDVEPGAKIVAKGNVIVMGTLKGNVHAGAAGDRSAFVCALRMQPKILKIADVVAKRQFVRIKDDITMEAKIATIDGDHIYLDPMN